MHLSEISAILNRDYPMLLIDGVTEIEPNISCNAFKNLSYNEWFFPQHFPKKPIMPGTLQVEAFTQAVAIPLLVADGPKKSIDVPILLAGIDKIRFYKSVLPGDRFDISTKIDRIAMGIASASAYGTVKNELVSECKITYKVMVGEKHDK